MSDYINLLGSEQVASAAYTIRDAADKMNQAASSMASSVETMQRLLDQFDQIASRLADDIGAL